MAVLDAAPYLPATVYLLVVTIVVMATGRCPAIVHAIAAPAGIAVHVLLMGWTSAGISAATGAFAFLFGVLFLSRLLTAVGLFSIVTAIAITPVPGWVGLGAGLALAAIVGTVRTVQVAGTERVRMLTHSTVFAMGVTPGGFSRPNPDMLPQAEDTARIVKTDKDARLMRTHLPPYLCAGAAGAALLAALF